MGAREHRPKERSNQEVSAADGILKKSSNLEVIGQDSATGKKKGNYL